MVKWAVDDAQDLKVREFSTPAPVIEEKKEKWNFVHVNLSKSGAGYGFNLPGAIAFQLAPFHGRKFEVKFRPIE